MSIRRTALTSLAALAATFSLSACNSSSGPAADQTGAVVEGQTGSIGDFEISETTSPHQPNAVIVAVDTYKGGGVAIVSTIDAEPAPHQILRQYTVGENAFIEFTPAADRNTVCTAIDGYESGDLACARVNRAASTPKLN